MKTNTTILICIILILNSAFLDGQKRTQMTAGEIIETIIRQTGSEPVPNTVDVIKTGKPETQVTGIVTCMFAPMSVLRKAVELKCNLIITHEPVFYNHRDETSQFSNDPVFLEKKKFIDDHGLVIWRFHDYIHRMKPDGIDYGMARKLQFDKYLVSGTDNRFVIPETTLEGLLKHLKKVFPGHSFNVIGNLNMKVSKVTFSAGAPGSAAHFAMLRDPETEVVIAGEVPQWETYEYVRDAILQGRNKAIIFLGHIPSEEAGMEYAAEWIKTFLTGIPVHFVECQSSYFTY
ncbi:MAG TPA: Nif3-like dinuclear metal center hexameric protein [Bacteroidales bacterium]|nr:Nif3-like dinuclear metal center hexameric protein [Bacteroidales bacterium]HOK73914.1 Nif3-like dinuclear metal center hexameric protein [Bacteroidales bacterium]HPP91957.1 Nif3-like dinuclear metal center hexameric protein [Bacteroidales bacterium]HRR15622.1 Nif3-like dinuclear metal center hexameric protein [Bacteroidales bacterium]